MKPCKNCIHHTACVTANPDMVKKTFECEHFEDKEKIKSALEKQIPKKPIIDTNYSGGRYTVGICPNCKKLIGLLHFAKDFKCCSECGQALDWGEEE